MGLDWVMLLDIRQLLELCSRLLESGRAISAPTEWFHYRWRDLRRRRLCTIKMSVGEGKAI